MEGGAGGVISLRLVDSHSHQESLNFPLEFGLTDLHLQEKQGHW